MRAAALAALLLAAAPAAAEPAEPAESIIEVLDREVLHFALRLPAGWTARPDQPLVFENRATGQIAAVIRIDGPTQGAWQGQADFFAGVESGVRKATPGYRRLSLKKGKAGGKPTLDLWFRRDGDGGESVIGVRFLFHRSFGLSLILETPAAAYRAHRREAARILDGFQPPPPR